MPRARTRDPEARRRRITGAALALFARQGFDGTSTAAVAAEAGVSEGLVFHHFRSKEGLLEACGAEVVRPLAEAQLGTAGGAEPMGYRAMVASAFSWVAGSSEIGRLWSSGDARLTGPLTRGLRQALVGPLAEALRREQAAGRVRPGDPAWLAGFQFAVVGEALQRHFLATDAPVAASRERLIDEAARIVRAIAEPDPPASPAPRSGSTSAGGPR